MHLQIIRSAFFSKHQGSIKNDDYGQTLNVKSHVRYLLIITVLLGYKSTIILI